MAGLPGLEKLFSEEFAKAKVQRCQVHVPRNVPAKVPRKPRRRVADNLRSIFRLRRDDQDAVVGDHVVTVDFGELLKQLKLEGVARVIDAQTGPASVCICGR